MEIRKTLPVFGTGSDESSSLFRPIGLTDHANILANQLLIFFFTIVTLFLFLHQKKIIVLPRKFLFINITVIFLSLLTTLSRSAYLSLFIFFLVILLTSPNFFIQIARKIFNTSILFKMILVIFLSFISFSLTQRFWLSLYSFSESGGFAVRRQLAEEAIEMIKKSPFLGVGKVMFIPALYNQNPSGVVSYFPESVHNGFLLFLAESGVISFSLSLLGLFFLVRDIIIAQWSKEMKSIVIASFCGLWTIMLLHPFINLFTFFTVVVVVITQIQYEKKYH